MDEMKSGLGDLWLPLALSLFCLLAFGQIIHKVLGINPDPKEPPFVPSRIPYFGHLVGIFRMRVDYYAYCAQVVQRRYGNKVFSLAMPAGRLYIINNPEHISSLDKAYREISFWHIEASLTQRLGGISDHSDKILRENSHGAKDVPSLVVDGMKATHEAMKGPFLDQMVSAALLRAEKEFDELQAAGEAIQYDLWKTIQRVFALASSTAVYGDSNPYEQSEVEQGLYTFADYTMAFLTGLSPKVFIRKGLAARETMVEAFASFFASRREEQASQLVRNRCVVLRKYGILESDIARFETVNGFGILLNLLPTAFWTTWHVLADEKLLLMAREEAKSALGSCSKFSEDISAYQRLPLITSIMHECLRYHTTGAAARRVMQDHMLSNRFLLKEGSYCLVPNKGVHFDKSIWGVDADGFEATRFLRGQGKVPVSTSFRAFGGGVNMCPGKAFATRLITMAVADLILRFNVLPTKGTFEYPGQDESSMAIVLARPKDRCMVRLSSRSQ